MKHEQTLSFDSLSGISSTIYEKTNFVKDFNFDFGFQYKHTFELDTTDKDKKLDLIIGATYEPQFLLASENLHARYLKNSNNMETLEDTLEYCNRNITMPCNGNITMPSKFSVGLSVELNRKWLFGFDYRSAAWSNFSNPLFDASGNYSLTNSNKMIFGVGFTPNLKITSKIWARTTYRLGLSTGKSQILNNGQNLVNYGISFGLAVPLRNYANIVGLSYEYGQLSVSGNSELLKEAYNKLTLSFTFNEKWFVKYKYD
ncbi:MAG: hypothetical protein IH948_10815 [Bacteroidetes bacterium]|nr:hypothetical protein [Bacteroidota bacterium]